MRQQHIHWIIWYCHRHDSFKLHFQNEIDPLACDSDEAILGHRAADYSLIRCLLYIIPIRRSVFAESGLEGGDAGTEHNQESCKYRSVKVTDAVL